MFWLRNKKIKFPLPTLNECPVYSKEYIAGFSSVGPDSCLYKGIGTAYMFCQGITVVNATYPMMAPVLIVLLLCMT